MHQLNNKCVDLLGYWDTILEYRGVSRIGRHLSSALSASLPLRTYDRFKKKEMKNFETAWKTLLSNNSGIMICDNFNRQYRYHGLKTGVSKPYKDMNVMINAVQAYPDRLVNPYPFAYLTPTEIVPSVPTKLSFVKPYFIKVHLFLSFHF